MARSTVSSSPVSGPGFKLGAWALNPKRSLSLSVSALFFLSLQFQAIPSFATSSPRVNPNFDLNLSLHPRDSLYRRAVQSEATCLDSFNWMDNSQRQSPCIVAAYLLSACAGGNWDIQKIPNNTVHYTPPTASNANGCRCSWAVYNTLQACADCQGEGFQSAMLSWAGYSENCNATFLSDTDYYPKDTPIPSETAIPFWAITDPRTWQDGLFNPSSAESMANEGHSDTTQSSRESSDSGGSHTGAIVGGVVGGIIGLFALALLFFYLRRRRFLRRAGGSSQFKPRPLSVRFSPLSHWRTGSSGSAGVTLTGTMAGGGKYAGQTASAYNNLAPSPGPTLPVSTMITGSSSGGPMYTTVPPSSGSFTSGSGTASPPLDYITHTQPGKPYGYTNALHPPPPGMGMVTMNNASSSLSNPTFSVSSAHATAAPSVSVSAMARNSHAHTLSNDSAVFSMNSQDAPAEGAITPFVLPPVLPEPMGLESPTPDGVLGGGVRSPTPGVGGKGSHGRGPSDSSVSNANVTNTNPTLGNRPSLNDLYTTANMGGGATRRPPPERRNPPAYSADPPSPPPPAGVVGSEGDEGGGEGERASVEAERAETTLSGTTLLQASSGSGREAPATVAGDGDADAEGERGAENVLREGERERERDRHGYPVDRKV